MNPMPQLIPMLKELRLSGIMDSLEIRNRQAIEDKMVKNSQKYPVEKARGKALKYNEL